VRRMSEEMVIYSFVFASYNVMEISFRRTVDIDTNVLTFS